MIYKNKMRSSGYRITIMVLWQLLNLGTGCTVAHTVLCLEELHCRVTRVPKQ